jgi:hypothetical protein
VDFCYPVYLGPSSTASALSPISVSSKAGAHRLSLSRYSRRENRWHESISKTVDVAQHPAGGRFTSMPFRALASDGRTEGHVCCTSSRRDRISYIMRNTTCKYTYCQLTKFKSLCLDVFLAVPALPEDILMPYIVDVLHVKTYVSNQTLQARGQTRATPSGRAGSDLPPSSHEESFRQRYGIPLTPFPPCTFSILRVCR